MSGLVYRVSAIACLLAASTASAQYSSNFEAPAYSGSAAGTDLTGQQGWQLPAGSVPFNAYTYAGNALGIPGNPRGGSQFIGGAATTAGFARAEHPVLFGASLTMFSWDTAVRPWAGTDPLTSVDNIASVSLQPSGGAGVRGGTQSLQLWQDTTNPGLGWANAFQVYDAAGANPLFVTFGPDWENLALDTWYRNTIVLDLGTCEFVSATITNLSTNVSATVNPVGAYLNGGLNNVEGLPLATALRFFAGGGATPPTPGNIVGFDNLVVSKVPAPPALVLLGAGLGFGARRRRRA